MTEKRTSGSAARNSRLTTKLHKSDGSAAGDPDCPPLTDEQADGMRLVSFVKELRWKLNMSREGFAAAYGIPLDTLRTWERRQTEPSEAELAYLHAIERNPEVNKLETMGLTP